MLDIVLASSSPSRAASLQQLQLPFITCSPDIDETAHKDESPIELVTRLSREKAEAVKPRFPHHLIIAGDQILDFNGQIIGKPHTYDKAYHLLEQCSGKHATFHAGLAVLNTVTGSLQTQVVQTHITFRELTALDINTYLSKDEPYNCAGGIRFEGSALLLLTDVKSDDPSAGMGLPIMTLQAMCLNEGVTLLQPRSA